MKTLELFTCPECKGKKFDHEKYSEEYQKQYEEWENSIPGIEEHRKWIDVNRERFEKNCEADTYTQASISAWYFKTVKDKDRLVENFATKNPFQFKGETICSLCKGHGELMRWTEAKEYKECNLEFIIPTNNEAKP